MHFRILYRSLLIGTLILSLWTNPSYAGPGELDPTFGVGGIVTSQIVQHPYSLWANSLRVQPDGKILIGGNLNAPGGDGENYDASFFIARYTAEGSPDQSFGTAGKLVAPFDFGGDIVGNDIALQPDGKIIAVGSGNSLSRFVVHRYNPDGTIDLSFGTGGRSVTQVGASSQAALRVVVQPDGKIVVGGFSYLSWPNLAAFVAIRYNPDGSQDASFGTNGVVTTSFDGFHQEVRLDAVLLPPGGDIVLVGASRVSGTTYGIALIRYNEDGSLDSGFGANGKIIHRVSGVETIALDGVVQLGGKIVVAGSTYNRFVMRFNSDGSLDQSFASGGIFTMANGTGFYAGERLAMQADGRIFGVGYGWNGTEMGLGAMRLRPNGLPDPSFGSNGRVVTAIGSGDFNRAIGCAIQPDGKMLAYAEAWVNDNVVGIALVRYQGESPPAGNGKIAFTSDRDGNQEIYLMNNDGTNQVRLTSNAGADSFPTFSPDGNRIAFIRETSPGSFSINLMSVNGTGRTEITPIDFENSTSPWHQKSSISWSPNGRTISFSEHGDIFTVNVDGTNRVNLTNNSYADNEPSWSPDGLRILFASSRGSGVRLYTIRPDGTDEQPLLTGNELWDTSPDWAPSGDQIAFVTNSEEGLPIIYTARDSGGDRVAFAWSTCTPVCSRHLDKPKWSPDGTKIAYHSWEYFSNDAEIFVKNLSESGPMQLTNTAGNNFQPSWQPLRQTIPTAFDFDGDGRADYSVFRPSVNNWYNLNGSGFSSRNFGETGDVAVPADYDGDGRTDIAVWRPSNATWYFLTSGGQYYSLRFGENGDVPVPADHDGDGKVDPVVYRPANNTWYRRFPNGGFVATSFGESGDSPLVGDFDGNGRADVAVFRPSTNTWYFLTAEGFYLRSFGELGDIPVPADYDGDGVTDIATFRPSTGYWYWLGSTAGFRIFGQWGVTGDMPVAADYDGDRKADPAVFRPSDSRWYIYGTQMGMYSRQFGQSGDKPSPAAFVF